MLSAPHCRPDARERVEARVGELLPPPPPEQVSDVSVEVGGDETCKRCGGGGAHEEVNSIRKVKATGDQGRGAVLEL